MLRSFAACSPTELPNDPSDSYMNALQTMRSKEIKTNAGAAGRHIHVERNTLFMNGPWEINAFTHRSRKASIGIAESGGPEIDVDMEMNLDMETFPMEIEMNGAVHIQIAVQFE